jgi:hypothetical protein
MRLKSGWGWEHEAKNPDGFGFAWKLPGRPADVGDMKRKAMSQGNPLRRIRARPRLKATSNRRDDKDGACREPLVACAKVAESLAG